MPQANPYPLRVDKTVMEKFKVIASENGRSVNKEVEALMKQAVLNYEKQFGLIQLEGQSEEGE